jgi:two-component system, OmpR family, response regulator
MSIDSSPSRHTPAAVAPARLTRVDGSPIRAVVVDDEDSLTDLLSMALRYEGWEVRIASDGRKALQLAREFRPDVMVLDIMLPDIDGMQVLTRLRADGVQTPVLFLTAKDALDDRVAGLTIGGDDYVTKPFSLEELVARLRGLIRRSTITSLDAESSFIAVGSLTLDEDSYEVRRGETVIELTATEFELLRFLMRNPRRVLSKSQILDRVWRYDFGGKSSIVELYISYLRKKIDSLGPRMIHTVHGVGYMLKPAD